MLSKIMAIKMDNFGWLLISSGCIWTVQTEYHLYQIVQQEWIDCNIGILCSRYRLVMKCLLSCFDSWVNVSSGQMGYKSNFETNLYVVLHQNTVHLIHQTRFDSFSQVIGSQFTINDIFSRVFPEKKLVVYTITQCERRCIKRVTTRHLTVTELLFSMINTILNNDRPVDNTISRTFGVCKIHLYISSHLLLVYTPTHQSVTSDGSHPFCHLQKVCVIFG